MAQGEKKPVVMEADLAVPGGVATLWEDGKLAEAQRPDASGLKTADGSTVEAALTNRVRFDAAQSLTPTQMAHAQSNIGVTWPCNPNLLDNWYFGNAVDQRGGYVVPANTPYYSNTELSTQVGTVSAYAKAVKVNETYGTITVSGTTYYVAWSAAVRGYTGAVYGIDRWLLQATTYCNLIINDGYITLYAKDNDGLLQKLPAGQFSTGDTITVSVLTDTELLSKTITLTESVHVYPYDDNSIWNVAVGKINGIWHVWHLITYKQSTEQAINIKAAKLELGTTQTLAHQDANGNWVLNEIPDYGEQLARCQREYINLYQNESLGMIVSGSHSGNISLAAFDIPVPVTMRAKPVITDVVSYGNLVLSDGTTISISNVIVDCAHASSIRVFVNNTGSTVFGPASLVDFKFCFAAYI